MTLQEFINETGMVITTVPAKHNPHMDGSENMDNYHVKLRAKKLGNATFRLYYSKGTGLRKGKIIVEPTAAEVLDCLASDASGIENASGNFEEWASEYGYDTDSRKAEKTFKTCSQLAQRLNRFLGSAYYSQLLWDIERL